MEKECILELLENLYETIKCEEHNQTEANGVWRAIEAIQEIEEN